MDAIKVSLILDSIAYSGDSVGRDWTFSIKGSANGHGFTTEYRSGVGPKSTVMPKKSVQQFFVEDGDAIALDLDVEATERDKKYSDMGHGSVELASATPGTVKITVKENKGPDVVADEVATLALTFRLAGAPPASFCPANIPADLPHIDVVQDLPMGGTAEAGGGTLVDDTGFALGLCPYVENRQWKVRVSSASAKIRWNVYPALFDEPTFPPAAGATVSCANAGAVAASLYVAYTCGIPTVVAGLTRPAFTRAAAEAHEQSHIADAKTYVANVFAAIQSRLSKEQLGSTLDTSVDAVKQMIKPLANQALADWRSGVMTLVQINKSAGEEKARNAGKPLIKPALDIAFTFGEKRCHLTLTKPSVQCPPA